MSQSIFENVPQVLRERTENPDAIAALLPTFLGRDDDVSLEQAISFLNGFLIHQKDVLDPEKVMDKNSHPKGLNLDVGWRYFKETVKEVKIIERRSDGGRGALVGKKAQIVFDGKMTQGDRKGQNQTIDTDWIEHEFMSEGEGTASWDMALARTIMQVAEEAAETGAEVVVCKHVWAGEDSKKLRKAIDIRILPEKKGSKGKGRSDSRSKGKARRGGKKESLKDALDALMSDYDRGGEVFEDADMDLLVDALADKPGIEEVEDYLTDETGIPFDSIEGDDLPSDSLSIEEYAVAFLSALRSADEE